jgi:hypothetical protein
MGIIIISVAPKIKGERKGDEMEEKTLYLHSDAPSIKHPFKRYQKGNAVRG